MDVDRCSLRDGVLTNGKAYAMSRELKDAAGGLSLPAHLAVRLASIIDASELVYLDVEVTRLTDSHANVKVIAVTSHVIVLGAGSRLSLGGRIGDARANFTVRSLRDVQTVDVAGGDTDWPTNESPRPSPHSITIRFADGVFQRLPFSERGRDGAPAVLRIIVRNLRSNDRGQTDNRFAINPM